MWIKKTKQTITNGERSFKASDADNWQKIIIIKKNINKYSITKMCKFLKICKATFYYKSQKNKLDKQNLVKTRAVINVFNKSYSVYGSKKIKAVLCKQNIIISRRKIRLIMQYGLISKYTSAKYKTNISKVNEEKTNNLLNRNFNNKGLGEVIVSDLTYVSVGNAWNYICLIIDLFNREIIGHSVESNKDAKLVSEALLSVTRPLKNTKLFHTDRGSEFKNYKIAETLQFFNITRSLSKKGCPYDNAVAEATYKIFKTELINHQKFNSLFELKIKVFDYIN